MNDNSSRVANRYRCCRFRVIDSVFLPLPRKVTIKEERKAFLAVFLYACFSFPQKKQAGGPACCRRKEATRTPDPYVPNVVRYQLRYFPKANKRRSTLFAGAKLRHFFESATKKTEKTLGKSKKALPLQPHLKKVQRLGAIAQLVEHRTENPCVPGSNPGGTTQERNSVPLYFFAARVHFFGIMPNNISLFMRCFGKKHYFSRRKQKNRQYGNQS